MTYKLYRCFIFLRFKLRNCYKYFYLIIIKLNKVYQKFSELKKFYNENRDLISLKILNIENEFFRINYINSCIIYLRIIKMFLHKMFIYFDSNGYKRN